MGFSHYGPGKGFLCSVLASGRGENTCFLLLWQARGEKLLRKRDLIFSLPLPEQNGEESKSGKK